jgi:hypothetical protein
MAGLPKSRSFLRNPDRRVFLWSLAGLGLTAQISNAEKQSERVHRFLTPECEVRMSVQYFGKSSSDGFRFRDHLTNRAFCLSADGERDQSCRERFVGSIAIARYEFRSRLHPQLPFNLRERVLTIDHDSRMSPRPPFEKALTVEREVASDIQAFGYSLDDPQQGASAEEPTAVWCLLRQDLYLNDQSNAFLIVHWKHALDFISLVDVIPGEGTKLISK